MLLKTNSTLWVNYINKKQALLFSILHSQFGLRISPLGDCGA